MHRRSAVLAGLILAFSQFLAPQLSAQITVIEGGTLIDGTGRAPVQDAVVVINGDRIADVSQKGKIQYPPGSKVIQAGGKFILPGLFDLHVHYYGWMGPLFLRYGVTSILDYNLDEWSLAQKEGIDKGQIVGPRFFFGSLGAGAGFAALAPDQPWSIPPGNRAFPSERGGKIGERLTTEEVRQRVRTAIREGALAIGEVGVTITEPEVLKAIADEAHKANVPVGGHLSVSAKDAVLAGVDSILHLAGVSMSTMDFDQKVQQWRAVDPRFDVTDPRYMRVVDPRFVMSFAFADPAKIDDLIQLMIQRGTQIEPDVITISPIINDRGRAYERDVQDLISQPDITYIPEDNVKMALEYTQGLYRSRQKMSSQDLQLMERGYRNIQSFIKKFAGKGGTVLAGADTHADVLPGLGLQYELQLLVDAGVSPMGAIQAATKNAAEWLHQQDRLGTVEKGKIADLVVVAADPLADIINTRKIEMVLKDGKLIDRTQAPPANPIPQPPRGEGHANPVPKILGMSPASAIEGNQDLVLTLKGDFFVDESAIEFDNVSLQTTYVNTRELKAKIPPYLLNRPGTFTVKVFNPKPFGGTSNEAFFIVKFK